MYDELARLREQNAQLKQWVHDLQSGMYINCVYCGHRYGPEDEVPASMADVLKAHIEVCPEHPMSHLKKENERLSKPWNVSIIVPNTKDYYPFQRLICNTVDVGVADHILIVESRELNKIIKDLSACSSVE